MIRWTPSAANDLETILDYISQDNPAAANKVARQIKEAVQQIDSFPAIGKSGKVKNTREMFLPTIPYVIIYTWQKNSINIIRILHTKIRYP